MTKLILVAAPSGAGKSSFVERICRDLPNRLMDVITHTTRGMRKGEVEGHPYHFVTQDRFEEMIRADDLVEWAKVHNNYYGVSRQVLEHAWKSGRAAIIDIDVQGVETIKKKFPEIAKTLFILPPSIDELRRRIEKRDGGKPADLEVRMQNAEREMAHAPRFDAQIVNDDFETSYAQFKKIIEEWLGPG
ncbi:MAG: guanylate kinase [Bdellovibrionaceae bacterium]|nr:guanylate kinase [Pseudobdellovibrionaceae bacterium]MBX3033455.1 guanylate kinase [Pseudobdellovibrionaceae bacterium]